MSEEKTKKSTKSKITSFHAYRDEMENPQVDQFLRESIMKEADALEARLNSDPKLSGISASDDMFDMIVGRLKAEGYWEDDEDDTNVVDNREDNYSESDTKEYISSEDDNNKVNSGEKIVVQEGAVADRKADEKYAGVSVEAKAVESAGMESKNEGVEIVSEGKLTQNINRVQNDYVNGVTVNTQKDACDKNAATAQPGYTEEISKIYGEQPEEVLRLMERGRKAEQEEKERARKRARRNKFVRRTAAAAAAFVLLFGVGMSTEASRGWILKMWDAAMEGFGFKAATDNVNDGIETRIRSEEEQEALELIKENLGVGVPEFMYLPEGMKFLRYEIMESGWFAVLFYEYNEKILSIEIVRLGKEGVSYYVLDQQAKLIDIITNSQNIEMEIWKTNLDKEQESYVADFEFEGCRYVVNGMIPLEEMKKILEIAIFL